jgi:hypothetical protein
LGKNSPNLVTLGYNKVIANSEKCCSKAVMAGSTFVFIWEADQGCQIFLGTTYPNEGKYTKLP